MSTEELSSNSAPATPVSLLRGLLVLFGALLGAAAIALPVAFQLSRFDGLAAASIAWVVCLVSGGAAQFLGGLFARPQEALFRVLFGMGLRMGVPLVVCLIVQLNVALLAEAGFVFYLMAFYFVTLAVELVTTVAHSPSTGAGQAKAA